MAGIFGLLMSGAGVLKDQYFNLTSLLLPGNGTNGKQNNAFVDSSTNAFSITPNGDVTQGTFSPFSQTGWGNYFIASSGLRIAHTTDFDFSTGNFTVESFIYPVSANANNNIIVVGALGSGFAALILKINASNQVQLLMSTAGSAWDVNQTSTSTVSLNTWSHIAVVRNGSGSNNLQVYVNGTSYISTTYTSAPVTSGSYEYVGTNGTDAFLGYMSNARIVKGQALSTGTFTPPTAPISSSIVGWTGANAASSITGTVPLVTCQSNRFVDTSSSPKTITVLGSPSVTPFSPFAPTSSYSAAAVGGSGYFDGAGDYLTVAYNSNLQLGSSDFTIDFWFYSTGAQGAGDVLANGYTSGSNLNWLIQADVSTVKFYASTSGSGWAVSALTVGTIVHNQWNHYCITRSGTTVTPYLNGVAGTTASLSGSVFANTSGIAIATDNSSPGTLNIQGYLTDFRIIIGSAVAPPSNGPTSPATAVTNTRLLLNFTNAGVVDATAKNVLETEGNAQISTAQSKWGGGSIAFDGTSGTYANGAPTTVPLGGGDFVVELWLYINASKAQGVFDTRASSASTAGIALYLTSGNVWQMVVNNAGFNAGGSITNSVWTHVAVVRTGTTLYLYVGGSLVNSTGLSNNLTDTTFLAGTLRDNADATTTWKMNGYIDDLRITKGNNRGYTGSSITVPTAPFPLQ